LKHGKYTAQQAKTTILEKNDNVTDRDRYAEGMATPFFG
jgi:hypothetical protein